MSEEIFIEILDKAKNNEFEWFKVPATLEVPEFVDTYQSFFSKISTINIVRKKELIINTCLLKTTMFFPVLTIMNKFLNSENLFAKVAVWKVEKTGYIRPHIDTYPYHDSINRYIINLNIDNSKSKFIIGNDVVPLPTFVPIFLNHKLTHSLENKQNEDLFFLQIDVSI